MIRVIHGLEVQPAPLSDEPALLCYTPKWEHREGTQVLTFEGDHVGAVVFRIDLWGWAPVDTEWWPLDVDGEPVDCTFGNPEENRARIVRFERPEEAVMFLAAVWNRNNPSQAVSLGKAA